MRNLLDKIQTNRLVEQKYSSLINETRRFKQLAVGKLGNAKPLLFEQKVTTHTGESLRWAIDSDEVAYYPGVTDIEGRKNNKGVEQKGMKPGINGNFKPGVGLLYFKRGYRQNGVQLNFNSDLSNSQEIGQYDFIVGTFDKGGLIEGKLYKNLGKGMFGEPAWDLENPTVLTQAFTDPND
jgi:hypothetical protein